MKLSIHCPSIIPNEAAILLNGQDITRDCMGIELSLAAGDLTRATIKILVDDLDVSVETLAMLQAHLNKPEPR